MTGPDWAGGVSLSLLLRFCTIYTMAFLYIKTTGNVYFAGKIKTASPTSAVTSSLLLTVELSLGLGKKYFKSHRKKQSPLWPQPGRFAAN